MTVTNAPAPDQQTATPQARTALWASLVGTTIEWYDFFLYATAASLVFNQAFFPDQTTFVGTMLSFATFAVGFVVRPIGGFVFGHVGDRIGRKKTLALTMLLMGGATALMGVLPTAAQIGVLAPILLLLLRVVQGFALGGEWAGAVLLAVEHGPARRRGLFGSVPQVGLALGLALGTGVFALLQVALPDEAFLTYGWRIAFLFSIVLVIFGVVMGSIYGGLATPTESAAIGVLMALGFVALNGRLTWDLLINCSIQSAKTSGMVIIVLVCSLLLNVTISMTGAAQAMTQWIAAFDLTQFSLLLVLLVFYVLLGTFMDAMSMLVLTVPIVFPVVVAAGIDPIWFGIFIVIMCEIALITPPVGMNLFVVHGVRTDGGSYSDVTRGSWPYVAVMMLFTVLLIAFPQLVMWLPHMLAGR